MTDLIKTPVAEIKDLVEKSRKFFLTGKTKTSEWRLRQLNAVQRLITENEQVWFGALAADLGSNEFWGKGVELETVTVEGKVAIKNFQTWMKPESVSTPLVQLPGSSYIQREPFGVVLIMAPWNYPVSLTLVPLIAAIAAGNVAIIKPSEISVNTSNTFANLFRKYLDPEAFGLVTGGLEQSQELLRQRFDFICYTGGERVAKYVMTAAAEHLTPTLLELGGKCPAIVLDDASLERATKRIAWGKYTMNMGQTCLSPDYVLTTPETKPKLIASLKKTLKDFYGEDPEASADVSRIVNKDHTKRLSRLLDSKDITIIHGGKVDVEKKYISPTVVTASFDSEIMKDEIFGPILPIVEVKDVDDAIRYVNSRPKPLGLYVFTSNSKYSAQVLSSTSSGGACVNDVIMHCGNPNLPFGGVGTSGMGSYHGRHGFETFSHKKAVYVKTGDDPSLRFPPYTPDKMKWLSLLRKFDPAKLVPVLVAVFGIGFASIVYRYNLHAYVASAVFKR